MATAAGTGHAPIAPGTFGSAVGVLLFLGLASLGLPLFALTVLALGALGVWASDMAERSFGRSDDGRIVIDEVVGQLLTLAPLVVLPPSGAPAWAAWLVSGFLLFRLLDIVKPGPVGWAERHFSGGLGVMADDVVAGLLGALLLGAAAWGGVGSAA